MPVLGHGQPGDSKCDTRSHTSIFHLLTGISLLGVLSTHSLKHLAKWQICLSKNMRSQFENHCLKNNMEKRERKIHWKRTVHLGLSSYLTDHICIRRDEKSNVGRKVSGMRMISISLAHPW